MGCFQVDFGFFFCAVALPLIVESIIFIIPINCPVVYPLAPACDGFLYIIRDVVRGDKEVFEG